MVVLVFFFSWFFSDDWDTFPESFPVGSSCLLQSVSGEMRSVYGTFVYQGRGEIVVTGPSLGSEGGNGLTMIRGTVGIIHLPQSFLTHSLDPESGGRWSLLGGPLHTHLRCPLRHRPREEGRIVHTVVVS